MKSLAMQALFAFAAEFPAQHYVSGGFDSKKKVSMACKMKAADLSYPQ
jgi:intein-encoded DNA endonuclease-like protein